MSAVIYTIVRHDSGWAYRANETISEHFATREAARKAAGRAATGRAARREAAKTTDEDQKGRWRSAASAAADRRPAIVQG